MDLLRDVHTNQVNVGTQPVCRRDKDRNGGLTMVPGELRENTRLTHTLNALDCNDLKVAIEQITQRVNDIVSNQFRYRGRRKIGAQ
jgi:hypothetical protein